MPCRCTLQRPQCARGRRLFAALMQAEQRMALVSEKARAQQVEDVHRARRAYVEHVRGWRPGDVRVRREEGGWQLETYEQERWVLRAASREAEALHAWLKEHGFWRYAQIDGGVPQDRLTGYYRQRSTLVGQARGGPANSPATPVFAPAILSPHPLSQATVPIESVLRPELDLKTQLALVIAVLVGREIPPLTPGDRFSIQRMAVEWLLIRGVPLINEEEVQTITLLIEEAIRIRGSLPEEQRPE